MKDYKTSMETMKFLLSFWDIKNGFQPFKQKVESQTRWKKLVDLDAKLDNLPYMMTCYKDGLQMCLHSYVWPIWGVRM